jgi:hypothetical protein
MPKLREVACQNGACSVDMFSIHYEEYVPEAEYSADYNCPGCGEREKLAVLDS